MRALPTIELTVQAYSFIPANPAHVISNHVPAELSSMRILANFRSHHIEKNHCVTMWGTFKNP